MILLIRVIVFIAVVILLSAAVAGFIPPSSGYIFALAGLGFPYFWMVNAFLLLLLLILRKRFEIIVVLTTLIITTPLITRYFSVNLKGNPKTAIYSIFDLNTFGLRKPFTKSDQLAYQDSLNQYLNRNKYTIACFQEYPIKGSKHAPFYKKLMDELEYPYKALSEYDPDEKATQYILLIASQYPVLNQQTLYFEGLPFAMYADIKFPEKVIRVYTAHMMSVKLTGEKKVLMLDKGESLRGIVNHVKIAVEKLIIAFAKREQQCRIIRESIDNSNFPVILAGDFNDTPVSYTYHQLGHNLKNASDFSFTGLKKTYRLSKFPLQIDYILHDNSINSSGYQKMSLGFSDHYAISSLFSINN